MEPEKTLFMGTFITGPDCSVVEHMISIGWFGSIPSQVRPKTLKLVLVPPFSDVS